MQSEEKFFRTIAIARKAVDEKSRRVTLAFSSELPVDRGGSQEILSHDPADVDLSRLQDGAPLLLNHDPAMHIGVVESARIESDGDRKIGRAVVRFGKGQLADEIFQDVVDGVRRHVSVGYVHTAVRGRTKIQGGPDQIRYAWSPYELSLATIPADPTVGVGRSNHPTTTRMKSQIEEIENPLQEIQAIRDALIHDNAHAEPELRSLTSRAIGEQMPLAQYRKEAFAIVTRMESCRPRTRMEDLGYDENERNSYSLVKAIQNCLIRGKEFPDPGTIEGDAHVRMSKLNLGFSPSGFLVPHDAPISTLSLSRSDRRRLQRDLTVTNFNQGGATVATNVVQPIIEILRNKMVTQELGVRVLSGLQGNVTIPRQTAAATAASVPETGLLVTSTQQLDQIALTPKRIGATNNYSKQLLIQSSIDVENFVRDDLLKVIALSWDRVILNGQGANSEALGIINTPGVQAVAFGGAATYAKMVSFETQISLLNAPAENRGYLTSSAVKGALKTTAKLLTGATTVTAVAIWEGDMVNGYPAFDTQQVPNNLVIFGSWSEVIQALWGGYDVVLDPYSLSKQAEVVVTINTWGDVAIRHPQSFCVSVDAGNQ